jgi:hypothetical protein
MNTGLLYHDDNPKVPLLAKVSAAAAYHLRQLGIPANRVHVHPSALVGDAVLIGAAGVRVVGDPLVPAHHFYVGVSDTVTAAEVRQGRAT